MDYIIVSTSRCNYQEWQLRVLKWSLKKVGQKGKLILLMSADYAHRNEKPNIDFGDDVEVIDLPDWAHEWKKKHDDWWGGIPNKYESFNWLSENHTFQKDDVLLFLDPDMIFVDKVEYAPSRRQIIGQQWKNYRPLKGWTKSRRAFMYPFCLRAGTLKYIKGDFKEFCFKIRKEEKRWESDMWALDYAAKNNRVKIEYVEIFGRCTVWQPNEDPSVSPIIHYPNVIKDANGEKIFFKQDYTFNPHQKINLTMARNRTDWALLNVITQERTDYLYFLKWDFTSIFKFYSGEKGFLVLQPWLGGFNNIRMSLELGICLALLTDRTLILPSTYNMYLLEGKSDFSDFFETGELGVKSMALDEFCQLKGIGPDEEEIKSISKVLDYDAVGNVINFEKVPVPEKFKKWRKVLNSEDLFDDRETIYLDKNQLGSFYQTLYTSMAIELKMLIAKYAIYRMDIFDLGWQFINCIGDRDYYAIHIRRNDFQYRELFISCEEILENIKEIIPLHSKLYVATDHRDKAFFKPLEEEYNLIFYEDLASVLKTGKFNVNWIPILEQLVCTRAIKFIGMKLSTLSSYVYRMRGYMSDIENKEYYINTEKPNPSKQCSFEEDEQFIANWAREYKDVWDFAPPTIFVSIAAYCDSQIVSTIKSLLENASIPSRIILGIHIQDTPGNYENYAKSFPATSKSIFTPKEESKGTVWARNKIKRELFDGEDFFLQIDAHSRFKKNWDNILINQYQSIEEPKVIITTYPNHFEISDEENEYLKKERNSPLRVRKFLTKYRKDNRLRPSNLKSLKDYQVVETRWVSAGFLFARGSWVEDIQLPDNIKFNGEEDYMTFVSYLKGYNLRLPSEATIWHNYSFKNKETGVPYKEFNRNKVDDNSINILNKVLFESSYERSLDDLETYLDLRFRRIKGEELIFIGIASFLDPELRHTIMDCVSKAKNPGRLRFGICLQFDLEQETKESCIDDLINDLNISIYKSIYTESKGLCWARFTTQQLYNNELYYLQMDAHTRLKKHWDSILIDELSQLKSKSRKPIISFRPPSYKRNDKKDFDFEYLKKPHMINIPKILSIDKDGCMEYEDFNYQNTQNENIAVPVLDGSFVFSEGKWVKEVEQDPNLYYIGEEMALSIRSYTKGYDIFTPKQIMAWHREREVPLKKHYNTHSPELVLQLHKNSMDRLALLFQAKDLGQYGLGDTRDLHYYMGFAGVNFKSKKTEKKDFVQSSLEAEKSKKSK